MVSKTRNKRRVHSFYTALTFSRLILIVAVGRSFRITLDDVELVMGTMPAFNFLVKSWQTLRSQAFKRSKTAILYVSVLFTRNVRKRGENDREMLDMNILKG
uniref:Uncharacterized protein n=1 Tax=Glossina brevipalpis TaxID=37001 RepID=A0A1A9WUI0_9MUSC